MMTLRKPIQRGILAGLLLCATPLHANPIPVRAGEHDGFTRLVIDLPKKTPWQLGRGENRYELRLADAAATFDISAVFARIPHGRLADVGSARTPGALALTVVCDCHADAFETKTGQIVIDVLAGKAAANSPFEVDLERAGSAGPEPGHIPAAVARTAATLAFRPTRNQTASLPIYWRSAAEAAGSPAPTALTGGQPLAPALPPIAHQSSSGPENPATVEAGEMAPTLPSAATVTSGAGSAWHLPSTLAGARAMATETEMLRQLSRAASQGLVKIDVRTTRLKRTDTAEPAIAPDPNPAKSSATASTPARQDSLEFHAETSIDRDMPRVPAAAEQTSDGDACVKDDAINLEKWGDGRPAAEQITEARAHLTGEFDKPDTAAVARLARLYLFFGFGAEARQSLAAFGVAVENAPILMDIGLILDDQPVAPVSSLHSMRDCDNSAAFWAFLAAPSPEDVKFSDAVAITRTFSGLPTALRLLLGPRVSERLIKIGAATAASAVRNAAARGVPSENRVVGLMDAEIALENGKSEVGEAALDHLADGNSALSSRAVLLAVRSRLARGEPIGARQAETLAALAFEHRASPDGRIFAHLEIMARAASGNFAEAFDSYARWKKAAPDVGRTETARQLFDLLAAKATDRDFLSNYFSRRALLPDAGNDPSLQLHLADRLAALGFAEETRGVLGPDAARTDRGRIDLARAALALFEAEGALRDLDGLEGSEVLAVRAEAETLLGDHRAAANALAQIGAGEAAGQAAWSGGDFARALQGPEPLRKAVAELGLDKATVGPPPSPPVTLEASKTILQDSAELRATLESLFGPADPAVSPAQQTKTGG